MGRLINLHYVLPWEKTAFCCVDLSRAACGRSTLARHREYRIAPLGRMCVKPPTSSASHVNSSKLVDAENRVVTRCRAFFLFTCSSVCVCLILDWADLDDEIRVIGWVA